MDIKTLKQAIKTLKLKDKWRYCLTNSYKLYKYFKGGKVSTGAFYNTQGLSYRGHWFYVTPDDKYVVDLVIHNHPSYKDLKPYEISKGIFTKEDYYNVLGV